MPYNEKMEKAEDVFDFLVEKYVELKDLTTVVKM